MPTDYSLGVLARIIHRVVTQVLYDDVSEYFQGEEPDVGSGPAGPIDTAPTRFLQQYGQQDGDDRIAHLKEDLRGRAERLYDEQERIQEFFCSLEGVHFLATDTRVALAIINKCRDGSDKTIVGADSRLHALCLH